MPAHGQVASPAVPASPAPGSGRQWGYPNVVASEPVWSSVASPVASADLKRSSDRNVTDAPVAQSSEDAPVQMSSSTPPPSSSEPQAKPGRPLVGLGGGARIGMGEPTNGLLYGRLSVPLSRQLALSVRPAYIFGGSDQYGKPNNDSSFQMPLTLDWMPSSWISPYLGVGLATNTDSSGETDPMFSGGVDFRLAGNLSLTVGLNYIVQSVDPDNRDVQGVTALYLHF